MTRRRRYCCAPLRMTQGSAKNGAGLLRLPADFRQQFPLVGDRVLSLEHESHLHANAAGGLEQVRVSVARVEDEPVGVCVSKPVITAGGQGIPVEIAGGWIDRNQLSVAKAGVVNAQVVCLVKDVE